MEAPIISQQITSAPSTSNVNPSLPSTASFPSVDVASATQDGLLDFRLVYQVH